MGFTKDELKEIEKIFDWYVIKNDAEIVSIIEKVAGYKDKGFTEKLLDEVNKSHDMFRTISAKAKELQDEEL